MGDYFIYGFVLFIFLFVFLAWRYIHKNRVEYDESEEGIEHLADTDICVYPFRNEWVTLTKIEYLNLWKDMNRQKRNEIFQNQQKKLKQGMLKKIYFENGTKYYLCATEKGKILSSIHQKKDKVYREGN